ncbi:hypothetical protein HOD24_03795 [Candidatus Peregrinibacteria bacterium]|jgi:two-component system, chemotaxis family, sensor kinase CheA|nr:hypothetical protein [Candidatus Peregrinibacteria bacterium]MBT4367484.1 hypothetical protein [Candidatus Peregrinibacteria bacterium]MBT4586068.1 hypothetical protein [Candidatus Peregrinibacteria bacterium]MBT6731125.1 hypothetical protein [Candidatus Peregrinibacteria bacterium]MBT7009012.1 hypothetical protein [Candidatus Peregrinibacteria bacterium]
MEQTYYIDLYVDEARDELDTLSVLLVRMERDPENQKSVLDDALQASHTCKSSSSIMGFDKMRQLFAGLEDIIDSARKEGFTIERNTIDLMFQAVEWARHAINQIDETGKEPEKLAIIEPLEHWRDGGAMDSDEFVAQASEVSLEANAVTSIRVNTRSLDSLIEMTSELSQLHGEMKKSCDKNQLERSKSLISDMGGLVSSLKDEVNRCRLVPVGQIVMNFPQLVRDIANKQGKGVKFSVFSSVSHIDKGLTERIHGPIIHLLRNAVGHGIETKEDRKKAGKSEEGSVVLRIERMQQSIRVIVEDDGEMIDIEELKKVAKERGISDETIATITEKNVLTLLTDPRFTSSKEITEVSGRGVGLSAVRASIESFAGSIEFEQADGKKRFIITVPAQLSVIESVMIESNSKIYAVPEAYVQRLRQIEKNQIENINRVPTVLFDDGSMPIARLKDLSSDEPALSTLDSFGDDQIDVLVLDVQGAKMALVIDKLLLKDTIMIKPMSVGVLNNPLVSGSTQLPSGTEVRLLGVQKLMRKLQNLMKVQKKK